MTDESTLTQKITEYPIDKDFQINPLLLNSVMDIKKLIISKPIILEKEVAVILQDEQGSPLKNKEGEFLYKKTIVGIFDGWKSEEVELPIPEFAQTALISANLIEPEISLIRNIFADIAYLIVRMIKEGKDYSSYIAQLYVIVAGITEPSKARNGHLAELMKTSITKGESKIEQTQREVLQEMKKKGLIEKFTGRH